MKTYTVIVTHAHSGMWQFFFRTADKGTAKTAAKHARKLYGSGVHMKLFHGPWTRGNGVTRCGAWVTVGTRAGEYVRNMSPKNRQLSNLSPHLSPM